jgi:hypothetical protein
MPGETPRNRPNVNVVQLQLTSIIQRSQSTTPVPVQLGTTQSVQQLYRYGTTRCSDLGTVLYRTDIAANVIVEEEGRGSKIAPPSK